MWLVQSSVASYIRSAAVFTLYLGMGCNFSGLRRSAPRVYCIASGLTPIRIIMCNPTAFLSQYGAFAGSPMRTDPGAEMSGAPCDDGVRPSYRVEYMNSIPSASLPFTAPIHTRYPSYPQCHSPRSSSTTDVISPLSGSERGRSRRMLPGTRRSRLSRLGLTMLILRR